MGDGEWPRRILDTHKRTTTTTTCLIFASGISRLNKCDRSFSRLVSDSRYLIESPRTTPDCLPLCRFFFAFYIRSLLESIEKGSFRSALELWSKYFRLGLIDREPSFPPKIYFSAYWLEKFCESRRRIFNFGPARESLYWNNGGRRWRRRHVMVRWPSHFEIKQYIYIASRPARLSVHPFSKERSNSFSNGGRFLARNDRHARLRFTSSFSWHYQLITKDVAIIW